jgi:hypothetical protein
MKYITNTIIFIALLVCGVFALDAMYNAHMQETCNRELSQSKEYAPHYKINKIDKEECEQVYNIIIDAPLY